MAAPTVSDRELPNGIKLEDGFASFVTFAAAKDFCLFEKSITPPGIQGGELIDTTTMFNSVWRTFRPRSLKTMTNVKFSALYDPNFYVQALAIINVVTSVTVQFSDGSKLAVWGALLNITPGAMEEGACPMCDVEVGVTNEDPVARTEEPPVFDNVAGT